MELVQPQLHLRVPQGRAAKQDCSHTDAYWEIFVEQGPPAGITNIFLSKLPQPDAEAANDLTQ